MVHFAHSWMRLQWMTTFSNVEGKLCFAISNDGAYIFIEGDGYLDGWGGVMGLVVGV